MSITRKIIETNDGSQSLLINEWGETYHSIHGAHQEALHVYINNGFLLHPKKHLKILEIGFGTGLNFCLTQLASYKHNKTFEYVGVEGYPIQKEEWENLKYNSFLENLNPDFKTIHELSWNEKHTLADNRTLTKIHTQFQDFQSNELFDVIYYDAFAYNYQPELWSETQLAKMKEVLAPHGFLVTYACKGVINRTLKTLGFRVTKLAGPKGKREMTVAYNDL